MKNELSQAQIDELLNSKSERPVRKATNYEYEKLRELLQRLCAEHIKQNRFDMADRVKNLLKIEQGAINVYEENARLFFIVSEREIFTQNNWTFYIRLAELNNEGVD